MSKTKTLFFVVNVDWFFLSHRLPLAIYALKNDYDVYLLTANTGKRKEIENYGIKFIEVPFERSGKNIFHELKCISQLTYLYIKYKPDIIHHVTLKASILGSIASKISNQKNVINAISGLGYNFTDQRSGILQTIVSSLINISFKSNYFHFIVQNPDDWNLINKLKLVDSNHIHLIRGSGIDLEIFKYAPLPQNSNIKFLFPARILKDKGILELLESAIELKSHLIGKARFILAGDIDNKNLAVFSEDELQRYLEKDYIEWIGFQKNMYPIYCECDVVILPSYREGLPKSLIEACAVGRPIITTNVPGCKECVINDYNGLLIKAKSVNELKDAILYMYEKKEKRILFSKNSRELAENKFSIDIVIEKTFNIYNLILNN